MYNYKHELQDTIIHDHTHHVVIGVMVQYRVFNPEYIIRYRVVNPVKVQGLQSCGYNKVQAGSSIL